MENKRKTPRKSIFEMVNSQKSSWVLQHYKKVNKYLLNNYSANVEILHHLSIMYAILSKYNFDVKRM